MEVSPVLSRRSVCTKQKKEGRIMASKYDGLARIISQNVRGKDNIGSL